MYRILDNGQVLKRYQRGRNIAYIHHTFFKVIVAEKGESSVTISLQDYLGNPLPYEPVLIRITGESALGEALEPYEGICEDGEIDLSGYVVGDTLMIVSLNPNVENAKLEVEI